MSSNIEKFDLLVAKLLANLYEQFPVATGVVAADYGINAERSFRFDGTPDPDIERELDFFCNTLRWLQRAGYIDYAQETNGGTFGGVVLTAKALEILKAIPESLRAVTPLGDYLVESARSGATDALKQGVTAALSAGAVMAWNALIK
ncbi:MULTISPECIES: hypothetical protein [Burkholderia]|uniref:hypothetical protein n=1 Tax=Burkholderia TaxID=32008 RepID=UPI0005BA9F84|nr:MULTISPECIES: hypothetical protein [Burkholderia]EKS9912827.1 hypothetical protein [Burkholderia multivorans]KOE26818.1 hypothetical protein AI46_06240 [Burkholderia multivorans R-20526]KVV27711.1 hypothetical protein WK80_14025 [Burkholderia multivorans]MBJ9657042.1 hypothetical protein [Burkholderia multivorans]MBJ9683762.1 hypothetical protein [Burkholderia multivorans]